MEQYSDNGYVLAEYVRPNGMKERIIRRTDGTFKGWLYIEVQTSMGEWQLKRRLGKEEDFSLCSRVQNGEK